MEFQLPALEGAPNVLAGGVMIVLAVALFYLDPGSRLHRAFALLLVLRGAANIEFAYLYNDSTSALASRLFPYVLLAVPFAALAFGVAYWEHYRRPAGKAGGRRSGIGTGVRFGLLGAALLVEAAYVLNHDWWGRGIPLGPGSADFAAGPLYLVYGTLHVSYATVTLLLARASLRSKQPQRRRSLMIVSLAFALDSLYLGAWEILSFAGFPGGYSRGEDAITTATRLLQVAAALVVAGVCLRLVMAYRAEREYRAYVIVMGTAAASAVATAAAGLAWPSARDFMFVAFDGVWTLANPLLVAYALVRHHLFDIDLRIKWTINRGTLAGIYVGVFFVAAQTSELFLQQSTGNLVVGGIASGLLLFAISPLQRFSDRIANAAMPRVKPVHELSGTDRALVYLEQARVAWSDGTLDRAERRMLDRLRETLQLSNEEAHRLEKRAESA